MTGLLKIRSIDPNLGSLRLDDLDLIDRLGRAFEKSERRVLSWAYFAKVLTMTVAKARTRVAILEAAGLLDHQSLRTGNVYFMTDKGQKVLRALRDAPTSSTSHDAQERSTRSAAAPRGPVGGPVAMTSETKAARRFVRVSPQGVMAWAGQDLGQRILGLPQQAREMVVHALEEGRDLTLPEVARAGLSLFAAVELLAAIAPKRIAEGTGETVSPPAAMDDSKGVGAPTPRTVNSHFNMPSPVRRDSALAKRAPVTDVRREPKRSVALDATSGTGDRQVTVDVAREGPPKPIEEGAVIALAQLAVNEAQRRHPELARAPTFLRRLLPELVWASMKGVLADYGEPLRRVRTALRLMADSRWTTPRHMPVSFVDEFPLADAGLAVC